MPAKARPGDTPIVYGLMTVELSTTAGESRPTVVPDLMRPFLLCARYIWDSLAASPVSSTRRSTQPATTRSSHVGIKPRSPARALSCGVPSARTSRVRDLASPWTKLR